MSVRPFTPSALQNAAIAGIGAAICIGLIAMGGTMSPAYLGVMAPFGATMVILFALPQSPLAQPKNIIGGHLLTASIGLVLSHYLDVTPLTLGLAVGLGLSVMMLSGTLHPPAGANPLLIMLTAAPWYFLITPVLTGCLFIVLFGWLYHRFVSKSEYPKKQGG